MLVASHSGAFSEDNYDGAKFWIGDKDCGWDSCTLNIANNLKRDGGTTIQKQFFNVGIPLPRPVAAGDKIEVCGNAYSDDTASTQFGILLTFINCDNRDGSGNYPIIDQLINDPEISYFDGQTTCFNASYIVDGDEGFNACNSFLVFGMNADGGSVYNIKFSYKISITQNCNPN
jgi:hypothetical protein